MMEPSTSKGSLVTAFDWRCYINGIYYYWCLKVFGCGHQEGETCSEQYIYIYIHIRAKTNTQFTQLHKYFNAIDINSE